MKKLILLMVLFIGVIYTPHIQAQQQEKIVVNVDDLTPEQLQKIKETERLKTMNEKIETYGKWVGVGNEVGVAIKEGLSAVSDVAIKFSDSNVGKFTMVLIAWKVVGKDIVRILLGIIFIIFSVFFTIKSFNRYKPHKYMVEGNIWRPWVNRKYEIIQPRKFEGIEFVKVLHFFIIMANFGITYAIMFG